MLTVENRVNGEIISMVEIVNIGNTGDKDDLAQPRKYEVTFFDFSPLPHRVKHARMKFNVEHNRIDGHVVLISKAMQHIERITNEG